MRADIFPLPGLIVTIQELQPRSMSRLDGGRDSDGGGVPRPRAGPVGGTDRPSQGRSRRSKHYLSMDLPRGSVSGYHGLRSARDALVTQATPKNQRSNGPEGRWTTSAERIRQAPRNVGKDTAVCIWRRGRQRERP